MPILISCYHHILVTYIFLAVFCLLKMKRKTICVVITVVAALVAIVASWTLPSIPTPNVKAAYAMNNDAIHRVQAEGGSSGLH